jgi:putative ABC transport system substrate-binding protein
MRLHQMKPDALAAAGALIVLSLVSDAWAAGRVAIVYSADRSAFAACARELVVNLESSDARPIVREFPISKDTAGDVGEFAPDVVAAVGSAGVAWATKNAGSAKVVSCLTLDPPNGRARSDWSGVSMRVSARDRLSLVAEALSKEVVVGVLYGEKQSEAFVEELEAAAADLEMKVVSVAVADKKDLGKALTRLRKDGADVVLGLADGTVYAGAQVVMILKYCHQYRLAFVGVSEAFAKAGALMAFYTTPQDQGDQAAGAVLAALERKKDEFVPPNPVRIAVNKRVNRLIRARVGDEFIDKADKTYGD